MKTQLDLAQMGLIEMNSKEMEEIEGGGIFGFLIGCVVGLIVAGFDGADQTKTTAAALSFGLIGAGIIPI